MADNVELDPGSGGAKIATDDDGTAQHQYVKLEHGADGTFTKVAAAAGLPVTPDSGGFTVQPGNTANTTAWKVDGSAVTQPVSGTLTAVTAVTAITNALPAGTNAIGKLAANSGVDIGDVDVLSVVPGTSATSLGKAEDAAHSSGDVGVMALAVRTDSPTARATTDGDYIPLTTDNAGRLYTAATATQSGTWNVGTVTTVTGVTTVSTVTALTGGGVAHDGADSGNPVKIGAKARTADITSVAAADRTDLASDVQGHILIRPYALNENLISGGTVGTAITNTTSTSMIAAQSAGIRSYITAITVTNSHSSVGTVVQIRDGSGGTVLWEAYCAANGGGATVSLPTPLRGTAATAVHAVCVTTGASVNVSLSGFKSLV